MKGHNIYQKVMRAMSIIIALAIIPLIGFQW
jgi:hypothetical protein